jgi:hypothetical protein
MLNAEDLGKIEAIRQFVADQGMVDLNIDIVGACDGRGPHMPPHIHMYFKASSSQKRTEAQAPSEGPPQS